MNCDVFGFARDKTRPNSKWHSKHLYMVMKFRIWQLNGESCSKDVVRGEELPNLGSPQTALFSYPKLVSKVLSSSYLFLFLLFLFLQDIYCKFSNQTEECWAFLLDYFSSILSPKDRVWSWPGSHAMPHSMLNLQNQILFEEKKNLKFLKFCVNK